MEYGQVIVCFLPISDEGGHFGGGVMDVDQQLLIYGGRLLGIFHVEQDYCQVPGEFVESIPCISGGHIPRLFVTLSAR